MKRFWSNPTVICLVALLVINLAVFHDWFFSSGIFTYGDWGQNFRELSEGYFALPQIWLTDGLGTTNLAASIYPLRLIEGIIAKIGVEWPLIERLLFLWPSVLLPAFSSFWLARAVIGSNLGSAVASLVYTFNTYMLVLHTGHLLLAVAFGLVPLVLWLYIKSLERPSFPLAVVVGLTAFASSFYEFRAFYLLAGVLMLYLLYHVARAGSLRRAQLVHTLAVGLLPFVIVGLLNAYWLIGLSQVGALSTNQLFGRGLFGDAYLNLPRAATLFHPFWSGGQPTDFVIQPIPTHFWLVPLAALGGLVLNIRNRRVVFFAIVAVIGVFLAKQSGGPFPHAYLWLYEHVPGFNAFREASKFYFLTALGYSVLIGAFVAWLWRNRPGSAVRKAGAYAVITVLAGIFLWNTKPLITGEIQTLFVPRQVPQDYAVLKNFLLKQPDFFRTYWVPHDSRWGFYTDQHPKISGINTIQKEWEQFVSYDQHDGSWPVSEQITDIFNKPYSDQLFDSASVKYVIVPLQDRANDDDFFINYGNDRQYYLDALNQVPFLKRIYIGTSEVAVYENTDYRPHLVAPNLSFQSINPTQYRLQLKNLREPEPVYFSEAFHPDWKLYPTRLTKDCPALKTSQTSRAAIRGIPTPPKTYTFQPGERYTTIAERFGLDYDELLRVNRANPNTLALPGQTIALPSLPLDQPAPVTECQPAADVAGEAALAAFNRQPAFESSHVKASDYANSWTVDPAFIKANYPPEYYREHPDGSIDVELSLFFRPQSHSYLGLFVSGLTALGTVSYLAYYGLRRSRAGSAVPGGTKSAKPRRAVGLPPRKPGRSPARTQRRRARGRAKVKS